MEPGKATKRMTAITAAFQLFSVVGVGSKSAPTTAVRGILMKRCVLVIALLYAGASCHRPHPGSTPAPSITSYSLQSGPGFFFESSQVAEYVARYGRKGWETGLRDDRTIPTSEPKDKNPWSMRVKDAFAYYYCRQFRPGEQFKHLNSQNHSMRDQIIAHILEEDFGDIFPGTHQKAPK